ncbi:MAG: hydroxymethylglutaryl-CoA synthase family protein [Nevskia sp.]
MQSRTPAPTTGIKAHGVFIPRLRLSRAAIAAAHAWAFPSLRGKGEKAICSWDEDALTLAVEACRDCLGSLDGAQPSALTLASTTAPFADLQNSVLIATALQLGSALACSDVAGSTRAGLGALAAALESAGRGDRLVVASERRAAKPASAQEMSYGSAAAALLIGDDDLVANYLGRESVALPFIDHFRQSGQKHDYYGEERWVRDEGVARIVPAAVGALLTKLALSADRIAWFGLAGAPAGSDKLVAKLLGIAPERVLPDRADKVGDTGAAHGPLLLASALEAAQPGDIIVVAGFAQGCEVLAFEKRDHARRPARGVAGALAAGIAEASYPKYLSFEGELKLDWGPRAETEIKGALTQSWRSADAIMGFVGGRCTACGAVQFPALPNCVDCGAGDTLQPYALADKTAKLATFSADWLQFYPAPPLYVGLVQFDGIGARLLMEIVDVGAQGIDVGTPLRMAFRVKARDSQRQYTRYFWKAVPTD